MTGGIKTILAAGVLGLIMGCGSHSSYSDQRPPVDQLNPDDSGLQSKDVISASDQMAQDLLALPELNASEKQWTIVITNVENKTADPTFNYDVFTERLRTRLSKYGHGRVALIENKATLHQLQSQELEQGNNDQFQQGGGPSAPGPAGIQPDYALRATIIEMPNRATSYYQVTFYLTNLKTRQMVWTNDYEVNAAR